MSALWTKDGSDWRALSPIGFPNEATLHGLIEEEPNLLPLSGAPRLTILGREVALPSGAADLLAVETTGQPVFIEIKLERNPEARRAVVAQVLSYAASVHGLDVATFEGQVLATHLRKRGHSSIFDAVSSSDETGAFDADDFAETLANCLATGAARLVLVLDAAPPELMRLAGYLEAVSERLVVDLITVSQYEVGGQSVIVPQRVDPGREQEDRVAQVGRPATRARYLEGGEEFFAALASDVDGDPQSRMVREWAEGLERDGLTRLATTKGTSSTVTLRMRLLDEEGGPVTVWKTSSGIALTFWGSVLRRRAPLSIPMLEQLTGKALKPSDNYTSQDEITEKLLDALTGAYREAAGQLGS